MVRMAQENLSAPRVVRAFGKQKHELDKFQHDNEEFTRLWIKVGDLLAVFPQGGITAGEEIQSVKSGAVLIALQAGVPIIPMHIYPRKHWYSRRVVVIGDPVDPKALIQKKFPSTADIERVSEKLMEEMNRCMAHQ